MASEIINMLRGSTLIKKALEIFVQMINSDEYLYNEAWRVITTQKTIERIPQYFYNKDIEVNEQEKEIRRLLFEHLSIRPKHDVSGCLALMSLIKDAERIGDYSKNIFEVGVLYKDAISEIYFFPRLAEVQKQISETFPKLSKAFEKSDEKMARKILENYPPIKKECDKVLYELFDSQLSTNEAIITAMLSRYFKRINSHASNIASGIVYPLNEIDFVRGDILE